MVAGPLKPVLSVLSGRQAAVSTTMAGGPIDESALFRSEHLDGDTPAFTAQGQPA